MAIWQCASLMLVVNAKGFLTGWPFPRINLLTALLVPNSRLFVFVDPVYAVEQDIPSEVAETDFGIIGGFEEELQKT